VVIQELLPQPIPDPGFEPRVREPAGCGLPLAGGTKRTRHSRRSRSECLINRLTPPAAHKRANPVLQEGRTNSRGPSGWIGNPDQPWSIPDRVRRCEHEWLTAGWHVRPDFDYPHLTASPIEETGPPVRLERVPELSPELLPAIGTLDTLDHGPTARSGQSALRWPAVSAAMLCVVFAVTWNVTLGPQCLSPRVESPFFNSTPHSTPLSTSQALDTKSVVRRGKVGDSKPVLRAHARR